ncbi:MAG: hypothetical protein ACRYF5_09575 [Janthinobacterium lividum]
MIKRRETEQLRAVLGTETIPGIQKAEGFLAKILVEVEHAETLNWRSKVWHLPEFAMIGPLLHKAVYYCTVALADSTLGEYRANLLGLFNAWQGVEELMLEFRNEESLAPCRKKIESISEKLGIFLDVVDELVFDDLDHSPFLFEMLEVVRGYISASAAVREAARAGRPTEELVQQQRDYLKRQYPLNGSIFPELNAADLCAYFLDLVEHREGQEGGLEKGAEPDATSQSATGVNDVVGEDSPADRSVELSGDVSAELVVNSAANPIADSNAHAAAESDAGAVAKVPCPIQ